MTLNSVVALEQTLLGHALNRLECFDLLTTGIDWQYFTASNHKIIAFCFSQMAKSGCKPHEDTFQLFVGAYPGTDRDYGGATYLRELKNAFTAPTDNYKQLIDKFKLEAVKLKIGGKHLENILKVLNDPGSNATEVRHTLAAASDEVDLIDSTDFNFKDTTQLSVQYIEELDKRSTREFCTTGFTNLDAVLAGGFSPGTLTTMAGFTGMAKSTLGIAMAHNIARAGRGVAYFSLEMSANAVYDKLVSSMTNIPSMRLMKSAGSLTDYERSLISEKLNTLHNIPLLINDLSSLNMDSISYQIRRARQRGHRVDVSFIDLFGKVDEVNQGDNLAQKIQRECTRMRILSQDLQVHFVMIVQIGRQGFGRTRSGGVKRPTLIDIKNANAYAEECDIVLLLHRNKYYMPQLVDDILEVDVAKQRMGEAGVVVYFEMFAPTSVITDTTKRPLNNGQAATE